MCDETVEEYGTYPFSPFIFPRSATETYDPRVPPGASPSSSGGDIWYKRRIRLKGKDELKDFEDSKTGEIPEIKDYMLDKQEHIKERELYLFAKGGGKDIAVCFLDRNSKGEYYCFLNTPVSPYRNLFQDHKLELTVPAGFNETGKRIKLECDCKGTHMHASFDKSSQRALDIPLSCAGEYYRFNIKVTVEDGDTLPAEETKFKVVATVKVKVLSEFPEATKRELTFIYSPYQGWTLTKDGELKQGREGYLIDENGLYILDDGRRVSPDLIDDRDHPEYRKYNEHQHRIGDADAGKGLKEILGFAKDGGGSAREDFNEIIKVKYETEEIKSFLYKYISKMPLVVYQAFQINICYDKKVPYAETEINGSSAFYSIGKDETGIPIVVTKIAGKDSPASSEIPHRYLDRARAAKRKKLVIGGPHGDERNAQRLIMAAQKNFIEHPERAPEDTDMYFIPCLSPTMAFADARGIPVIYENGSRIQDGNGNLKMTEILGRITIPYLHDFIAANIGGRGPVLRTLIQSSGTNGIAFASYADYQSGKLGNNYPRYGIDANRDVWATVPGKQGALPSTQWFVRFIRGLISGTYAPKPENVKVIMMHGYDDTGTVYGTYTVNPEGTADMVLAGETYAYAFWNYLFDSRKMKPFYDSGTDNTKTHPFKFAGEWSQILYKNFQILSVDIELPNGWPYNEGYRGEGGGRAYKPNWVKNDDFNKGVLVTGGKSFYDLLETYSVVIDEYISIQRKG